MKKRSMFVGMDVHQHSMELTIAESEHDGLTNISARVTQATQTA